jgi:hypothetical protein
MIPLVIAVLLGLAALLVVVQPLLAAGGAPAGESAASGPLAEAAERERSAKQTLRDVELDHRLGNLEDSDYTQLRQRYEERALAALKTRYDRERALDALIDQQLARLRVKHSKRIASPAPAARGTARFAGGQAGGGTRSVRARRRKGV